jgi:phosphate/sulfate permease
VTRRILYAWLFTLPGAGLLSTIIYLVMSVFV